jgi:hypothetical protein
MKEQLVILLIGKTFIIICKIKLYQEEHWKQNDFIMHLGGGAKNKNEKYIKMKNFIKYNNVNG